MRVHVRMIRQDMLSGEEEVLLETAGLLNGSRLLYRESEEARQSVSFGDEIILERHADVSSRTVLRRNGDGFSRVFSPYGTMEMTARLIACTLTPWQWETEYQVLADDEKILHQKLIWQISPEN